MPFFVNKYYTMKNIAIKILKTEKDQVKRFNALLGVFINSNGNPNLIRSYNARGFNPTLLDTLEYDVKQHLAITNADLANFKEDTQEQVQQTLLVDSTIEEQVKSNPEAKASFMNILKEMNEEEKTGLRFSSEYPFLRDKDCPNELKILANDAITSFHTFKELHQELFDKVANVAEPELTEEQIFKIANELLENFELNREIHAELEYYKEHKDFLAEHPIFEDYKIEKEIKEMTAEELSKAKNNLKANISKKKKALKETDDEERKYKLSEDLAMLEKKQKLVDERLKEK
ncbi:hypothetical protein AB406_0495 [Riemerella anatipestifer]|uniref:Uncharacterized protein n=2 Tax=Riemerella anatipestifer TaxID=34085 RepID=A0A1S7DQQ2_RIEAN|nr:hypothetical protein AB406_0495 [Riemerella anatipestifer]